MRSALAASDEECFDEQAYLERHRDVAAAVSAGGFTSGRDHFARYGQREGRLATPRESFKIPQGVRVVGLICVLGIILWWCSTRSCSVVTTAVLLALTAATFGYFDYIVGKKIFVFRDIAVDTIEQFLPMMTHLSNLIWNGELPMWSFSVGMGQNVFPSWLSDPFAVVAMLSGSSALPYMLGVLQVVKILVAVGCMAAFFRQLGYGKHATIIGALAYGFCGHMIARGTWYEYATEVVALAFYLFAFERFMRTGRYLALAAATCLVGCSQIYYAYLYGLVLLILFFVRVYYLQGPLFASRRIVLARYALVSLAGIAVASVFLIPDMLATLSSTRVSGEARVFDTYLALPWLTTEHAATVYAAVARGLSPNLLGNANRFSGTGNYLEAPLPYAGLLSLLCVIPCFVGCTRRARVVLAAFIIAVLAYHYLTFFRATINAFAGPYFKISGLWIAAGLAIVCATTLNAIERSGRVPRLVVGISGAVVFGLFAFVDLRAVKFGADVPRDMLWGCLALTAAYMIVLLFDSPSTSTRRLVALLALVTLEASITSLSSVGKGRKAIVGTCWRQDSGYGDATAGAIKQLKSQDGGFFRIERDYSSVSRMDALMQGYFGTQAYLSLTNSSYVDFLKELGALNRERRRPESYLDGIGRRPLLLALTGTKYFLTIDEGSLAGFARDSSVDARRMILARGSAALGYVYDSAITRQEFEKIASRAQRDVTVITTAVVDIAPMGVPLVTSAESLRRNAAYLPSCANEDQCVDASVMSNLTPRLAARGVRISQFSNNHLRGSFTASSPSMIFFSIPFDQGWRLMVDGEPRALSRVNVGFLGAEVGPGTHTFALDYRTPGLMPGAILALISCSGLGLASAISRARKKTAARGSSHLTRTPGADADEGVAQ